jgi:ABC-type antimicrobial peptide transport system permease subunit
MQKSISHVLPEEFLEGTDLILDNGILGKVNHGVLARVLDTKSKSVVTIPSLAIVVVIQTSLEA